MVGFFKQLDHLNVKFHLYLQVDHLHDGLRTNCERRCFNDFVT